MRVRPATVDDAEAIAALALAHEEGIARVELDVWSFNGGAREFFQRQGFRVFNERMCLEAG